jgi:glycosyltransferase involved in cell wall biosynthesis
LRLAWRRSTYSNKSLAFHLVYLAEACQLAIWLKEFKAEHVHVHFGTNPTDVAMLARELGAPPYSFTVHGPDEFDLPLPLGLAEKIRRAAFVIAVSSYGRSQLYRWVNHKYWDHIAVVHCGLEQDYFSGDDRPDDYPKALVCVGRLCEQKGQLLLIEAARRLRELSVQFELVLAGDGDLRPEIETLISNYGLGDHIRITGWISSDQVKRELRNARGMVLPSFAEGLPVVIMEAFALRRPVITTYIAGIPELVVPGQNGLLIPAGSVDELVNAMAHMLSLPNATIRQMGVHGHDRTLALHSVDVEAAKLVRLIELSRSEQNSH